VNYIFISNNKYGTLNYYITMLNVSVWDITRQNQSRHINCITDNHIISSYNAKSSQVKYIYIALFAIQIVSNLLHSINQDNWSMMSHLIWISPTEQAKGNSGKEPKNSIKW